MSGSAFVVAVPNVEDLADNDINALVDLYVFSEDALYCPGRLEYHYISAGGVGTTYWQCDRCHLIGRDARTTPQHRRAVPNYCKDMGLAWQIVEKIKALDDLAQIRFEMRAQVQYRCCVLRLTGRMIAIAALQVLDVVDAAGFVVGKREVSQ